MGSVLSGIGSGIGSIGGGVAEGAGATNDFQAQNPYSSLVLQDELNKRAQLYAQQQNLAQALQAQSLGFGPNPAQTQYQMNQGANIANAQGLIASQRGLNPALAARMGANQATAANSQAALGSALLQQQQQLGAQNQLGNILGQMQGGNLGQQQLYTQGSLGAQNLAQQTGAQNAQTRGQMAGATLQTLGTIGSAAAKGGAAHGGKIPGKAKVPGDSPENDTVNINVSPGEIVIPRSKAEDPKKAKEFIDHIMNSKDKGEDSGGSGKYGSVLESRRKIKELEARIKALEKKKAS